MARGIEEARAGPAERCERRMRPRDTPKNAAGPAKAAGPLLAPGLLVGERGFEPPAPASRKGKMLVKHS